MPRRSFAQLLACGGLLSAFAIPIATQAATIRAVANNNFVSATAAGTSYLTATAATASTWEDFQVINNADGTVSFRATISANFVSADTSLAAPNTNRLIANRAVAGDWEKFRLETQSNGTVLYSIDDQNGFIAGTEDEWVEKLSRLLRSHELRQRLGHAGRVTVEQKYSAITQAPRVYEIFKSVLRGANVPVDTVMQSQSATTGNRG